MQLDNIGDSLDSIVAKKEKSKNRSRKKAAEDLRVSVDILRKLEKEGIVQLDEGYKVEYTPENFEDTKRVVAMKDSGYDLKILKEISDLKNKPNDQIKLLNQLKIDNRLELLKNVKADVLDEMIDSVSNKNGLPIYKSLFELETIPASEAICIEKYYNIDDVKSIETELKHLLDFLLKSDKIKIEDNNTYKITTLINKNLDLFINSEIINEYYRCRDIISNICDLDAFSLAMPNNENNLYLLNTDYNLENLYIIKNLIEYQNKLDQTHGENLIIDITGQLYNESLKNNISKFFSNCNYFKDTINEIIKGFIGHKNFIQNFAETKAETKKLLREYNINNGIFNGDDIDHVFETIFEPAEPNSDHQIKQFIIMCLILHKVFEDKLFGLMILLEKEIDNKFSEYINDPNNQVDKDLVYIQHFIEVKSKDKKENDIIFLSLDENQSFGDCIESNTLNKVTVAATYLTNINELTVNDFNNDAQILDELKQYGLNPIHDKSLRFSYDYQHNNKSYDLNNITVEIPIEY